MYAYVHIQNELEMLNDEMPTSVALTHVWLLIYKFIIENKLFLIEKNGC